MKPLARALAAALLAFLARAVLGKYKPIVVMITGSVGKTSTKEAAAAALSEKFYLRASEKSYNSEFGVPLTIFGVGNPWTSLSGWLGVIGEALALIFLPSHYPKLLVLEVGADRPGDLSKILRITAPDAVIVTRLPDVPVHVEAYSSPAAVREEEFAPATALAPGAPLIICADDPYARELAARTFARVITYGMHEGATVQIAAPSVYLEQGRPAGMEASATTESGACVLRAPGVIGRQQLFAPAAAYALARALGMTDKMTQKGLARYVPPPGRARILQGIKGAVLIDDTYNASPAAAEEILQSLRLIPARHRVVAVLGDMLELGRYSKEEHARIGKLAAESADVVIGVGPRSRALADAAQEIGKAKVLYFENSEAAAAALPELIREGDTVLIKGSQSIRTERVTEALLADSKDARLLVRQEKEWKRR